MSVSIDTRLSSVDQDALFIVNLKTLIIKALRGTLDDKDYPDRKIGGIKVSMEFPMEQNKYPHVWVEFTLKDYQQAGIGHTTVKDGKMTQTFMFSGTVRFTVMALTSYERDIYASQLLQLLAFGKMHPIAIKFAEMINADPKIRIGLNEDIIRAEGQGIDRGTPWQTNDVIYEDVYSMDLIGEMDSAFHVIPSIVRGVGITGKTHVAGSTSEIFISDGEWH